MIDMVRYHQADQNKSLFYMNQKIKIWLNAKWDEVWLFLQNIPKTIRESIIWFLMTYLMPLVQIMIIWGIKQDQFSWSIEIMNIILVTSASLYSAIIMVVNGTSKDKGIFHIATIAAYVITVVLFSISMVEINKNIKIFDITLYRTGTVITLLFALLLGLVSKYDEVKAKRVNLANKGKKLSGTTINEEEIAL